MLFGGDIIWTSGNMGANSTLNADLLDGQHGAWYQDLTNSAGTLPNARLSGDYSFGGLSLSGTLTASGLIQASAAANTNAEIRLNVGGIKNGALYSEGTGTQNLVLRKFNPTTGAGEGYLRIDGNGVNDLKYNGNTVWHAANDGSGSGLDAGLLEGQNAAYFRNLANSTGTLPSARISGNYTGFGDIAMTGTMSITNASPSIILTDTTAGSYNTRIIVDSNNWYLQKQADGTTSWTTFAQFEMDTTNAYVNGAQIWTQTNHNHLNIGTTAATARSAMGLGGLATMNIDGLVYTGSTLDDLNYPIGSTVVWSGTTKLRNEAVVVRLVDADNTYKDGGTNPALTGTWRHRGRTSNGENLAQRTA